MYCAVRGYLASDCLSTIPGWSIVCYNNSSELCKPEVECGRIRRVNKKRMATPRAWSIFLEASMVSLAYDIYRK
jgi:hypothetical protein